MAKTSLHRCDPNGTLLFAGGGSLAIVTSMEAPLKLLLPLLEGAHGQTGINKARLTG
jgi:hypothetical protein